MIDLIADSIRNHFILDPLRKDKLMSDDNYEDSSLLSVVIFVGLCRQHGISKEDICTFLGLEPIEYDSKISRFYNTMDKITDRVEKGTIMKKKDYTYRAYVKYSMCYKYISNRATRRRGKELVQWRNFLTDGDE